VSRKDARALRSAMEMMCRVEASAAPHPLQHTRPADDGPIGMAVPTRPLGRSSDPVEQETEPEELEHCAARAALDTIVTMSSSSSSSFLVVSLVGDLPPWVNRAATGGMGRGFSTAARAAAWSLAAVPASEGGKIPADAASRSRAKRREAWKELHPHTSYARSCIMNPGFGSARCRTERTCVRASSSVRRKAAMRKAITTLGDRDQPRELHQSHGVILQPAVVCVAERLTNGRERPRIAAPAR
jgi:hypothetical protein